MCSISDLKKISNFSSDNTRKQTERPASFILRTGASRDVPSSCALKTASDERTTGTVALFRLQAEEYRPDPVFEKGVEELRLVVLVESDDLLLAERVLEPAHVR